MSSSDHTLYRGHVLHTRLKPFRHSFRYRVFSILLDIDRLETVSSAARVFSYNQRNLYSFYDKDHGPRDGSPLRPWVESMLSNLNQKFELGTIKLFCYPRIFGYVFNPLSVYYCFDVEGALRALIFEVSNTFGEGHSYVGQVHQKNGRYEVLFANKTFYVSPFIDVAGEYHFRFDDPGQQMSLAIQLLQDDDPTLFTRVTGHRVPFTMRSFLGNLFLYPLLTLKVISAIHWQALKLWVKGASYVERPGHKGLTSSQAHLASRKQQDIVDVDNDASTIPRA